MSAWKTVALHDVATIERSNVQPEQIESGTFYVGLEHIEAGGALLAQKPVDAGVLASSKFKFTERHILYGKLRPYLAKIASPDFSGICSTDILPILPGPHIERRFLLQFLRQPPMVDYANSRAVGINLPRLSPSVLAEFEIPLPPLQEQRRIARVLDQAETLGIKRRAALVELDTLTQAIFVDLFGDPVLNRRNWPLKKFGDVGTLDRGVSKHRPRNAPELLGGSHPLVQTGEVANCDGYVRNHKSTYSDLGLRQSKLWPAGTLCITIAANIAKTGILTFDACFPDSVVGFRADDASTVEYVRTWLSFLQKALEESAPESAQKNINLAILRDLDVPLPPLTLRQDFARRIAAVEKLKAAHRASLAELDALFAALQHRAFRGEL
jgi:type I restriction enzyme S subunit